VVNPATVKARLVNRSGVLQIDLKRRLAGLDWWFRQMTRRNSVPEPGYDGTSRNQREGGPRGGISLTGK